MIKELLTTIVLISAFPLGYLLAYLTGDELVDGRKYFILLFVFSLIASLIVAFLNFSSKLAVILTLFFIAIVSLISAWKSYDKKFLWKNNIK